MRIHKITAIVLCMLLVFVGFAACSNEPGKTDQTADNNHSSENNDSLPNDDRDTVDTNDTPSPDNTDKDSADPKPDDVNQSEDVPAGNMNPLTGLYDGISDEALSQRPVAIMVGNSYGGLPQWGIGDAAIIYEMIAEARMTRLMAIYQDYTKIVKISAVRSARPYFIDIAQSYGAVFVHYGGSETAVEQIAQRDDLIDIDGIKWPLEEIAFPRDADRKAQLGSEHSVYTTGELLKVALDRQDKSLEQTDHPSAFNFADTSSAENGTPMTRVQVTFKSNHEPYFVYDEASGEYLRFQYQQEHIDGLNNEQISVKNLLILRMELTDLDHYLDIVDITTTGTGVGYYFCEGKYVEITWKKDSYNSPINYYTLDGNEIVCKPGQTFVSVVTENTSVVIE